MSDLVGSTQQKENPGQKRSGFFHAAHFTQCSRGANSETELGQPCRRASVGEREAVGSLRLEWGGHGPELRGGHGQQVGEFHAQVPEVDGIGVVELAQVVHAHVDVGTCVSGIAAKGEVCFECFL